MSTSLSAKFLNSVLNVKGLVGAFNQVKALVEAISVIVKTDGSFAALLYTWHLVFTLCSLFTVTRSINTIPS